MTSVSDYGCVYNSVVGHTRSDSARCFIHSRFTAANANLDAPLPPSETHGLLTVYHILSSKHPWALGIDGPKPGVGAYADKPFV